MTVKAIGFPSLRAVYNSSEDLGTVAPAYRLLARASQTDASVGVTLAPRTITRSGHRQAAALEHRSSPAARLHRLKMRNHPATDKLMQIALRPALTEDFDDGVRRFHFRLDSEAYDDIVRESDEAFQNSGNRDEIMKFLAGVHSKLGHSRGFTRANIFVNASTNGTFITVSYQSTLDQGNAVEAFTWKKADGGLKLVRYDVNSNVFLTR